jgi:F-type H+-transporting ATPase subunit gamma
MASLKEVRGRIVSVSSTQQITKAMKMVSAAKLRRATDAIVQMRPYAQKLREVLENLSGSVENNDAGVYSQARPANKVLIIAITSNRGLCGAFNANVIRKINGLLADKYNTQYLAGNVKVLSIGRKAAEYFAKNSNISVGNRNTLFAELTFANVEVVAEEVMKAFREGEYDRVELVYNQFKNAVVQILQVEQLLPISQEKKEVKTLAEDYIFEPGKQEIVLDLIPKAVKIQLYKAILDSHASEHGARMTAMSKATDNAQELIKELKLKYNKARQAAITKEILEIVGGAEALNG